MVVIMPDSGPSIHKLVPWDYTLSREVDAG